jgi:hypothetical protein
MVSGSATSEPYPVTPTIEVSADGVREWVRGEDLLTRKPPNSPFFLPAEVDQLGDLIKWMPKDRAKRVTQRYFDMEEEDDQ